MFHDNGIPQIIETDEDYYAFYLNNVMQFRMDIAKQDLLKFIYKAYLACGRIES